MRLDTTDSSLAATVRFYGGKFCYFRFQSVTNLHRDICALSRHIRPHPCTWRQSRKTANLPVGLKATLRAPSPCSRLHCSTAGCAVFFALHQFAGAWRMQCAFLIDMFPRWTLTLLASIALTACGGGGSGDSSPSIPPSIDRPTPQPPGTETPDQPGTPGVSLPKSSP